jgi:hypothetical protein
MKKRHSREKKDRDGRSPSPIKTEIGTEKKNGRHVGGGI